LPPIQRGEKKDRSEKSLQTSAQWWEEKLVEDYRDYRWRQLMEPMCDKMQSWKAGEFTHADMDQALEECHQQVCELCNILNQRKDGLVMLIQWLDREWFEAWAKEHRPPPDARLASPPE
jgi:hypothetical protein